MYNKGNIVRDIEKIIFEITKVNNLDGDDDLLEHGIDSLLLIQCIVQIEKRFEIEFSDSELSFDNLASINKLVNAISEKL